MVVYYDNKKWFLMENKLSKIKELLMKAQSELNNYKSSGKFTNLSQACEKTWVAFVLLLELKSGKEIHGTKAIRPIALELGLDLLYANARNLHNMHYEGVPDFNDADVVDIQDTIYDVKRAL